MHTRLEIACPTACPAISPALFSLQRWHCQVDNFTQQALEVWWALLPNQDGVRDLRVMERRGLL